MVQFHMFGHRFRRSPHLFCKMARFFDRRHALQMVIIAFAMRRLRLRLRSRTIKCISFDRS
jgi:hypothetical protein